MPFHLSIYHWLHHVLSNYHHLSTMHAFMTCSTNSNLKDERQKFSIHACSCMCVHLLHWCKNLQMIRDGFCLDSGYHDPHRTSTSRKIEFISLIGDISCLEIRVDMRSNFQILQVSHSILNMWGASVWMVDWLHIWDYI